MRKKQIKDVIVLNKDTKILYDYKPKKDSEETTFTIKNKKIETIINFYKSTFQYDISIKFKEGKTFHKNSLYISNGNFDPLFPAYKFLNLEHSDGTEQELEQFIDLDENDIYDEIYFIMFHDKQFNEKDTLRSFYIITPLIRDLLKDFRDYKPQTSYSQSKKLVKKN